LIRIEGLQAAPLTGERDQVLATTGTAMQASEAVGQDATAEVLTPLALDIGRNRISATASSRPSARVVSRFSATAR
jgi:hypothetical protein